MNVSRIFTVVLLAGVAALASGAKAATHEANCSGVLFNEQASVQGIRVSEPYGRTWRASFRGQAQTENAAFKMAYEGIATDAFPGRLWNEVGTIFIKVLDMTEGGSRMYILGGRESLGPPERYGAFVCNWIER